MTHRPTDYLYIFATIALTVYGQLILKARIGQFGALPEETMAKARFLLSAIFDIGIFSGLAAAFLASFAWMAAMTKFELSHAYPFMSLNFVVVLVLSVWMLGESMTMYKLVGVSLIVAGTMVVARG